MGFSGMLLYYTDAISGYGYGNGIMYALPPTSYTANVFSEDEYYSHPLGGPPHRASCDPLTAISLYCLPSKFELSKL